MDTDADHEDSDDGQDYEHWECDLCGSSDRTSQVECQACGDIGCERCVKHSLDDCIGYLCSVCRARFDRGGKSAESVVRMRFAGDVAATQEELF